MTALRKVLVVDDDPVVRKSFDRVLSGKGYAVITAESGEEALHKLDEERYDIVYSDVRMPGMSGLEVAENVKARRPWTPVVIITGYGTEAAEARAKAAGVSSFLHKPLSPEMIEDSVRDTLAATAEAAEAVVLPAAVEAPAAAVSALKNMVLFFAAPFIGLAYIVVLPFVGLGFLAVLAARTAAKIERGADGWPCTQALRDGDCRALHWLGLRRLLPVHRLGHAGLDRRSGAAEAGVNEELVDRI